MKRQTMKKGRTEWGCALNQLSLATAKVGGAIVGKKARLKRFSNF
jgi:hypothetical protein